MVILVLKVISCKGNLNGCIGKITFKRRITLWHAFLFFKTRLHKECLFHLFNLNVVSAIFCLSGWDIKMVFCNVV